MPSIMTLEGPNLNGRLGWIHPDVHLGGYGKSPGCVNCAVLSDTPGQNAATDATNVATSITNYTTQLVAAQKAAMYAGIIGSIIGLIAGSMIGRRFDKKKNSIATVGGAIGGGVVLGYGSYYVATQALTPTYVAPPSASTSQALNILNA